MKIVIATQNAHKLKEFKRILKPLGYEVLSQADIGVCADVEETGKTFEENAAIKARAVYNLSGMATVADDSGLEVKALDGQPGIYSARYGGGNLDDKQKCSLILKELGDTPKEQRDAQFVCVIHVIFDDNKEYSFKGVAKGYIGYDFVGENGFGYDPIFMIDDTQSFATISPEQKDKLSHRGKALRELDKFLQNFKGENNVNQ